MQVGRVDMLEDDMQKVGGWGWAGWKTGAGGRRRMMCTRWATGAVLGDDGCVREKEVLEGGRRGGLQRGCRGN